MYCFYCVVYFLFRTGIDFVSLQSLFAVSRVCNNNNNDNNNNNFDSAARGRGEVAEMDATRKFQKECILSEKNNNSKRNRSYLAKAASNLRRKGIGLQSNVPWTPKSRHSEPDVDPFSQHDARCAVDAA